MDEPVQLRLKPVVVDAIKYTGDNADKIVAWLQTIDPTAYSSVPPLPMALPPWSDGSTLRLVPRYIVIYMYNSEYVFNLHKNEWIFKNSRGRLSLHNQLEVDRITKR